MGEEGLKYSAVVNSVVGAVGIDTVASGGGGGGGLNNVELMEESVVEEF